MILSDSEILRAIESGEIVIKPFSQKCLGSNSYDVHLSEHLLVYTGRLDAKKDNPTVWTKIPEHGFEIRPGKLYLGSTIEYTENPVYLPFLDGKSSVGRLGISVHATAGKGDIGFNNHWTLEISCIEPVVIYPGMPIAQLIFHEVKGDVLKKYGDKKGAKYTKVSEYPQPSAMFKNFTE